MDNKGIFYTDSNAFKIVKRDINNRNLTNNEKKVAVSSYFYPINSGLYIHDESKKNFMAVFNDRS